MTLGHAPFLVSTLQSRKRSDILEHSMPVNAKHFKFGLAVVVLAAALGGCGGGGGDSDSGAAVPLTRAQFTKKANAVCGRAEEAIADGYVFFEKEEGIEPETQFTRTQAIAVISDYTVPALEKQAKELEALGVPRGEDEFIGLILRRLNETIRQTSRDPAAFIAFEVKPWFQFGERSKKYGLQCGP